MARNGSGTYSLPAGNPVVTGTTIQSTWANTTLSDLATAITQSISQDGQTPITANLPMGGFKLTGLSAGTTAGDSVRYEQFASPPAIGGTAAAAGSFTTLSASSTVSGTGFSAYLASPPAIGGTAAAAANFTTIGATGQITSTVATGTAPMVVASTTEVANLHAATATSSTNVTGTVAIANGGTGQTTAALAGAALGAIGVGQTWQNLIGSRSVGVTYTNTTGRPISVYAYSNAGPNLTITLTVGGVVVSSYSTAGSGVSSQASVTGIVPDNTTYVVALSGVTLAAWSELR